MIELIVSVCLQAQPGQCKDVHLTYTAAGLTPFKCVMGGQPYIAKWVKQHPKWYVKRWRCARPGKAADI